LSGLSLFPLLCLFYSTRRFSILVTLPFFHFALLLALEVGPTVAAILLLPSSVEPTSTNLRAETGSSQLRV
jgi:hypothetical protein